MRLGNDSEELGLDEGMEGAANKREDKELLEVFPFVNNESEVLLEVELIAGLDRAVFEVFSTWTELSESSFDVSLILREVGLDSTPLTDLSEVSPEKRLTLLEAALGFTVAGFVSLLVWTLLLFEARCNGFLPTAFTCGTLLSAVLD